MEERNNPFKVPEGYFDDLQKRMEIEAKRKHVSVSRVLKYVASISLVLTLSASVFVIGFSGEKKESLLSSNLFSIFTNKDAVEKKDVKSKSVEEVEEVWEKQLNNLIAEAEAVQFTEAELEYLENFIDEDVNEYVYNNLEILE
jgi:hypothetical protein